MVGGVNHDRGKTRVYTLLGQFKATSMVQMEGLWGPQCQVPWRDRQLRLPYVKKSSANILRALPETWRITGEADWAQPVTIA